jgi:hypothetical protein
VGLNAVFYYLQALLRGSHAAQEGLAFLEDVFLQGFHLVFPVEGRRDQHTQVLIWLFVGVEEWELLPRYFDLPQESLQLVHIFAREGGSRCVCALDASHCTLLVVDLHARPFQILGNLFGLHFQIFVVVGGYQ